MTRGNPTKRSSSSQNEQMINVSVVFLAVSGHKRLLAVVFAFLFLNECDIKELVHPKLKFCHYSPSYHSKPVCLWSIKYIYIFFCIQTMEINGNQNVMFLKVRHEGE